MNSLDFSARELIDLAVAWVVLGVAFAVLLAGGRSGVPELLGPGGVEMLVLSLITAGVGFLLHELGHKVVAIRFGQVAEFRADYGMLFVALMSALVGFLFAAPGAVHHRGRLTERQHGLIALAGPVVNLGLTALFFGLLFVPVSAFVVRVGALGVVINSFLAAFNMIPFASLDGKTVLGWSKLVWLLVFGLGAGVAATAFLVVYPLIGF